MMVKIMNLFLNIFINYDDHAEAKIDARRKYEKGQ